MDKEASGIVTIVTNTDETKVFLFGKVTGLTPGKLYRFTVSSKNKAGFGHPSPESYSATTMPDKPCAPEPPCMVQSTLSSITFRWSTPLDDGGTAVLGYRYRTLQYRYFFQYVEFMQNTWIDISI